MTYDNNNKRVLPMQGAFNFRDLGGIETEDGRKVKLGKLFRSGELSRLTQEDCNYICSIPVVSIIDFRDTSEVEKEPDIIPHSVANVFNLHLSPGNLAGNNNYIDFHKYSEADAIKLMIQMYYQLLNNTECIKVYKKFFSLLVEEGKQPLLFHCTAGKDRTGLASALFYFALGVNVNTIIEDYLLSNLLLNKKYGKIKLESVFFKALIEVTDYLLLTTFEQIRKKYKSIDNYLNDVLAVDFSKLKEIYLEK